MGCTDPLGVTWRSGTMALAPFMPHFAQGRFTLLLGPPVRASRPCGAA